MKKKINGYVIGGIILVVAVVAYAIWYNAPAQKEARKVAEAKKLVEDAKKAAEAAKTKSNLTANGPLPGSKMQISR